MNMQNDSDPSSSVTVSESSEITHRVTIATTCRALTRCMNISYVGHGRATSLLSQYVASMLRVFTIFLC
jgi:hypothetical protein